MARFEYQHECLSLRIIRNLCGSAITSAVTGWSTDYALIDDQHDEVQFVSVKHKEANQNAWTLAQLLKENVLADLFQVWVGMGRRGRFTFESDPGVDTDLASFLQQPTAARWRGELDRIAGGLGASSADLEAFLAVFTVLGTAAA